MIHIPEEYFKNNTIYRSFHSDTTNGIFGCGFMNKKSSSNSDINLVLDYYAVLILLSGEGLYIDNENREFNLHAGSLIQRVPGKAHSLHIKPDGQWLEFFICFGREIHASLSNLNLLDSKNDVLYPGINNVIFKILIDFIHSLKKAKQEDLPLLLCEAEKIIFTLYRMHKDKLTISEDKELIDNACLLLNQSPYSQITVQEVCTTLGVGYEKFRKIFKSHIGTSPGNYILQKRINTAQSILLEQNKSIKKIALELGYPDAYSFSKQFKKITGINPTDFRKIYK
ncbi:transcriptional regulator, AraC family [Clostridium grantii DSM 8605]|uniref:Transcriptional regulator, AraC family n=2 Tax=Clostridium TaxID=1485 RepID=A0A1M5TMB9_9CLOT|nr:transcriptional regulator, AraC family [Clostridium grantii DSM 8605]